MPASSGYIGAGNKTSVFNRKPKVAFEKIRSHLDHEFEKAKYTTQGKQRLSHKQREQIKSSIRKKLRAERQKEIAYAALAILLGLMLLFLASKYLL